MEEQLQVDGWPAEGLGDSQDGGGHEDLADGRQVFRSGLAAGSRRPLWQRQESRGIASLADQDPGADEAWEAQEMARWQRAAGMWSQPQLD